MQSVECEESGALSGKPRGNARETKVSLQDHLKHPAEAHSFTCPMLVHRHTICTLPPLDAALTMRFAQDTQHNTSEMLRLPRKITISGLQNAAPATTNARHVGMSQSATATRNEATRRFKPPRVTGCGRNRNDEDTPPRYGNSWHSGNTDETCVCFGSMQSA